MFDKLNGGERRQVYGNNSTRLMSGLAGVQDESHLTNHINENQHKNGMKLSIELSRDSHAIPPSIETLSQSPPATKKKLKSVSSSSSSSQSDNDVEVFIDQTEVEN